MRSCLATSSLSFEDGKSVMMNPKYFNYFANTSPFDRCTSRSVNELAAQISRALKCLGKSSHHHSEQSFPRMVSDDETPSIQFNETPEPVNELPVVGGDVSAGTAKDLEKSQEKDGEISSTPSTSHTQNDQQTPMSLNSKSGKRKQPHSFTPDVQIDVTKKTKEDNHLQQSCEDHLVSATSHFIPINKLELPPKVRQFRRVNQDFVKSLEAEMEKNPAGSYGALFVVARDISNRREWKVEEKDSYTYEVLGGTHLSLATKEMNKKFPTNKHFQGRMCRIYVGIDDEQALFLGAMHQQTSMFQHEVTYMEDVERCRMLLFGCEDISGDPPIKPRTSWREDCSRVLRREKKPLSDVFAIARVGKEVWAELQQVNSLYEKGKLKDQKLSSTQVMSLKQWHMKPLCSLTDDQRLPLLRKVKEKEVSFKELKIEAQKAKALADVQIAIANFFQLKSWEEAKLKFGDSVKPERLLRFKGDFEKLNDFKLFLKHLQTKQASNPDLDPDDCATVVHGPNCRGHVVFSKYEDLDTSSSYFENGTFLSIGHVGYNSEDVVTKVGRIIDLVHKINFVRLVTSFNIIIVSPTAEAHSVLTTVLSKGAVKAQQGYIINKGNERRTHDLLMPQVVDCFVVGHWSVTGGLMQRHVSKVTSNLIELVDTAAERNPEELYEFLIEAFSLQEDHILDLDSENGNGMLAALKMERNAIYLDETTSEGEQWQLTENIRERAQSSD